MPNVTKPRSGLVTTEVAAKRPLGWKMGRPFLILSDKGAKLLFYDITTFKDYSFNGAPFFDITTFKDYFFKEVSFSKP